MNTCETCVYWIQDVEYFTRLQNDDAKRCFHPNLGDGTRPRVGCASVIDAEDYLAALITHRNFGCVMHSPVS